MSANAKPAIPHLVKDPAQLARWLESSQAGSPWNHDGGGLSLAQ